MTTTRDPRKIAVSMQKGGVGKTTISVNLPHALELMGYDTLLIDTDPQGYATKLLGHDDQYRSADGSLAEKMLDAGKMDEVNDLIINQETFDLIPSHADMVNIEGELQFERRAYQRLSMTLDEIDQGYDYIIMDTPTNLGPITDNAILAAGNVLFPLEPRPSAEGSLNTIFQQIQTLEDEFQTNIGLIGGVINQTRDDDISREQLSWITEQFGENNIVSIPIRAALQRAWSKGQTIYSYEGRRYEQESIEDLQQRFNDLARISLRFFGDPSEDRTDGATTTTATHSEQ